MCFKDNPGIIFKKAGIGTAIKLMSALLVLASSTSTEAQVVEPQGSADQLISLNFRDAPIEQVLSFYSDLTGRTILKMPNIKATVTLRSQGKLTKRESLQAIESILVMHNISLVPMGAKFLKVVQSQQASQTGMKINMEQPEEDLQESDQMITQVIQLKHIEIGEIQGVLQSLLHGFGKIQPLQRNNAVLVTATSANIQRILELLDVVDQPPDMQIETRVYELKHASAEEIKSKLTEFVEQVQEDQDQKATANIRTDKRQSSDRRTPPGVIRARRAAKEAAKDQGKAAQMAALAKQGMIRGKVRIVADDRTNVLFIFSRPENFTFLDRIVEVLDRQVAPKIATKVVGLEYADAEDISSILNEFVGAVSAEEDGGRGGGESGDDGSSRSQALRDFIRQRASARQRAAAEEEAVLGRLSPDTKILADTRTNSLLLMGRQQDIEALMNVIKDLDIILAQVLIEAVIVEVNLNKGTEYGIDWLQRSMTVYNEENLGPDGGLSVNQPVFSFAGGQQLGESADFQDASSLVNRDIPLTAGGLSYYLTAFDLNLDAVIRMAASSDDARILSTPVILTTDNTEAKIVVGEQRPVVTSSSTTVGGEQRSSYEYKDIGINLAVTPRVNPERYVVMEVAQNVDNVGGFETIDGNRVPIITKRELEAQIAVQSKQTIVMGGLVSTDTRKSRAGVPILSKIPVLGTLFRSDKNTHARRELLVLLTPYVMYSPKETLKQTKRLHNASYSSKTEWHEGWSGSSLKRQKERNLLERVFNMEEETPKERPEEPGFEGKTIIKEEATSRSTNTTEKATANSKNSSEQ